MDYVSGVPAFSSDSFKQWVDREKLKVSRRKEELVNLAAGSLLSSLTVYGYAGQKIVKTAESLKWEPNTLSFTGSIVATVSLIDKKGQKTVDVTIDVKSSQPSIPAKEVVDEAVAGLKTKFEELELPKIKASADSREKDIQESITKGEQEFKNSLAGLNNKIQKESYSPTKTSDLAHTLRLSSAFLPEEMQINDLIYVEGVRYRLISKNEASASANDDGAYWVFELVTGPVTDMPKFTHNL